MHIVTDIASHRIILRQRKFAYARRNGGLLFWRVGPVGGSFYFSPIPAAMITEAAIGIASLIAFPFALALILPN